MKRLLLVLIGLATVWAAMMPVKRKTGLKPAKIQTDATGRDRPVKIVAGFDSASRLVRFLRYDMERGSEIETFYILNLANDTLLSCTVEMSYYSLSGQRLHSRTVNIDNITVPPSERRHCSVTRWKDQNIHYYYLGPKPKKENSIPVKVAIDALRLTFASL